MIAYGSNSLKPAFGNKLLLKYSSVYRFTCFYGCFHDTTSVLSSCDQGCIPHHLQRQKYSLSVKKIADT